MQLGSNSYLSIFKNCYDIFRSVIDSLEKIVGKKHVHPILVFEGPKSKLLKEKKSLYCPLLWLVKSLQNC